MSVNLPGKAAGEAIAWSRYELAYGADELRAARAELARVTAERAVEYVEYGVRWKIDGEEQPVSTFSTSDRRSEFLDYLDSRGPRFVIVELVERHVTPWEASDATR